MKIWLNNLVSQEREINEKKLMKEFTEMRLNSKREWPLERELSVWLACEKKIEGKSFAIDQKDFPILVDLYFKEKNWGFVKYD